MSLAWPLVSLTLSSLALCTIAFLHIVTLSWLPGAGRHGVGDLTGVDSVVHQEQLEVLLVTDKQLFESIRQHVTSLLSRTIADGGEGLVASESSTDSAINTVGESPGSLTRGEYGLNLQALSCTYRKQSGWGASSAS